MEGSQGNESVDISDNKKRTDYIVWDEYFMAMTILEINRWNNSASDAAIILNERKIIISCSANLLNNDDNLHVNHAEYQALKKVQCGATMYTLSLPCEECAELIVEKGIGQVVYAQERDNCKTKDIFQQNNVICRQFTTEKKRIVIDFNSC